MSKRNPNLDMFHNSLQLMSEDLYPDQINVPIKVFEDVNGNPVYKTPREIFIWFGRFKEQQIEIKEDLNLLDPAWAHAERLNKFEEYANRIKSELDEEIVFDEIGMWYLNGMEGEVDYSTEIKILFEMYRTSIATWELQYQTEFTDEILQKLKESGVVFAEEPDINGKREVEGVMVDSNNADSVSGITRGDISRERQAYLESEIFRREKQRDVDYPVRDSVRLTNNPAAKFSLEGMERQIATLKEELDS